VPIALRPEESLRRQLEAVGDEGVRERSLGALSELECAGRAVGAASGDASELDRALGELECTFERLTGARAKRSAGQMYAARTLMYEDCRRDVTVELGGDLLRALDAPLSLLLASARWFTHSAGVVYRKALRAVYAEMAAKAGSAEVDFVSFWYRVQPLLFKESKRVFGRLQETLQSRWQEVLRVDPDAAGRAEYDCEQLRPLVRAAFDAPDAGWACARYHSPDVMIAAPSAEAVRRGQYQLVLGELHVGVNTLSSRLFSAQHADPRRIARAVDLDLPHPRLAPLLSKSFWPNQSARLVFEHHSGRDWLLELAPGAVSDAARTIPLGALVVREDGGEPALFTRDGRLRFDLLETFADFLSLQGSTYFKILAARRHTPRISFGRLVVGRETWAFGPREIPFAFEPDEARRFVAARGWRREHRMPRFVFVKSPVEVKPVYVDFDSPTYLNIFARIVRRTDDNADADKTVVVTEMLPDLNQVWLPDGEGRLYTTELRIVALDRRRA
jgi:hypothetical protein